MARKPSVGRHHLARGWLGAVVRAQTKLEWSREHRGEIALAMEWRAVLPAFSTANLRELMRAALPVAN